LNTGVAGRQVRDPPRIGRRSRKARWV